MPESLGDLLSRLREDRILFLSGEEATRQGAILPILARLDWNRDNIREVVPEFRVGNGRVDYCLKVGEKSAVFIEVKRTNEELEQHQEQLLDYAFRDGVEIAVLTNGLLWWFYLPLLGGSWDQRKFFTIDIQQQEVEAAAKHFKDFLSRDAIATGSAVGDARTVHAGREKTRLINQTIPKAWTQLCQGPDELLLELFAEKVESLCGHRPDQQLLAEHLASVSQSANTPTLPFLRSPKTTPLQPHVLADEGLQGLYTNKKPVVYTFRGERRQVSSFQDILMGICSTLSQVHAGDFDRVLNLQGRKRAYFSRTFKGMTGPKEIPGSGIYVETNLAANGVISRCHELLQLFGYSRDQFRVEVQER